MPKLVLSTTTNKLHIEDCYHLKGVMEEHKKEFDTIKDAKFACDKKVSYCKHCLVHALAKGEII